MANWLTLIIVGLVVYTITLAPVFPPAWRPLAAGLGGILVVIGILVLVLGLLGVAV